MDVYLSKQARQHLRAQGLESPRGKQHGLLIGHRRGGRFFVETVFPCPFRFFPSARKYRDLDGVFEGKIIGFYASGRRSWPAGAKFPPFACNKLCLEFDSHPVRGLVVRPAVVEYTGDFHLVPVALAERPKRKR